MRPLEEASLGFFVLSVRPLEGFTGFFAGNISQAASFFSNSVRPLEGGVTGFFFVF